MTLNRVVLPGAVRAHDADKLTLTHLEGNVIERDDTGERFDDGIDAQQGHRTAAVVMRCSLP